MMIAPASVNAASGMLALLFEAAAALRNVHILLIHDLRAGRRMRCPRTIVAVGGFEALRPLDI